MKLTWYNPTGWRRVNSVVVLFVLITLLVLPHSSWQQQSKYQSCSSKERCDECIRSFGCVWCADPDFTERRCQREGDSKCSAEFIQNPGIEAQILDNRELTVVGDKTTFGSTTFNQNSQNVVQISPQSIFLRLRPNEGHAHRIHVRYRQAQDYPVDLYYLMDLSNSMKDDKESLSLLGNLLADTMTNMTSNFRLGFGSFVDKVAMPFVSIVPKNLREPCPGCAAPYGFRNVMKLNTDTSSFSGQVQSANVSGNLDAPEGGFDAIMQAVVCQDEIGWRDKARKLLVFSTDSSFHYAGDGKLAGIVKPNDGCCHLDECGMYTYSTTQDYPSVSQINHKVKEYSINLIFAVTAEQTALYEQLSAHIEGSSCGTLSANSSNVVALVKEQYEKITSSIELREKNLSPHLRVRYFTRCLNTGGPLMPTNKCDGLRVGQTVEFEIEVELLSCPKNKNDWLSNFSIYPVGVREELHVQVEMICDCGCAKEEFIEVHSARCSSHGTLKCGICECDVGYSGDDCNCTEEADKTDKCRPDSNSPICSDHGVCKCNQCSCSRNSDTEIFWGKYCECNNFSCPRVGGVLCAGHGECVCGKCVCQEGWIGENCACDNGTSNCVAFGGEICSSHGTCQCNKCVCGDSGGYFGQYCQKCPTCPDKCADLKPCVECKVYKSGTLSQEQCEEKCDIEFITVDTVQVKDDTDVFCTYLDERDCRATFTYTYRAAYQKQVFVTAQKNKECPPQALIVGVVFQLISTIVLIGLAFLITWKIITSMKDRREFARFEKERMMAKWDAGQNPIYKQATSTFKNPTYCGS